MFDKTAEQAAYSSIYLASSPEVEGATGIYVNTNGKRAKWNAAAYDDALRTQLWTISERQAHIKVEAVMT